MSMMIELRGNPVARKNAKTDDADVLYWVGVKENFWKPAGVYKFINLLGDPVSPRFYLLIQFVLSVLMDVISVLPLTFMLYKAGCVDLVQALFVPIVYLTLPHLNSVEIRFESFGQRTIGPVFFQAFIATLWFIVEEYGRSNFFLEGVAWYFFIYLSYKTSLFGFQLAIFVSVIYSLVSATIPSVFALFVFMISMYLMRPIEFSSFLGNRILHTRLQWKSRSSDAGVIFGSSALVDSIYRILWFKFSGLFGSVSNPSVIGGASIELKQKLTVFLKSVIFNKNDELIRILISNSVFIIPLIILCLMGGGAPEGLFDSMIRSLRSVWGDAITNVYVAAAIVTALVLFVPRLVAFGEASRYLNHALPQTLAIFFIAANIISDDGSAVFALAGLLSLSVLLSVLKFFFYEKKVAGRKGIDTAENIKCIFRKPPKNLLLPELDSLENFIRKIRIKEGIRELRLLALPLKNNSSFMIANYIISKQIGALEKIKVYSMWRDSSIFINDAHFNGDPYLPIPMSFGPLGISDVVILGCQYNYLYQKWLSENAYHQVYSDLDYCYYMRSGQVP